MNQLVEKFAFGPRGLAPNIPVGQQPERLVIRERESPHEFAGHCECLRISPFALNRSRCALKVCSGAPDSHVKIRQATVVEV